jgi:alanine racemase
MQMSIPSVNRVEINLAHLRHNFRQIKKMVGDQVDVLAMVKAEAYGHGLEHSASALAKAGARFFGVAEVEEGVRLRRAGINGNIIITLGPCLRSLDEIVGFDLQPVIFNGQGLEEMSRLAVQRHSQVSVHLKIDVGMGRLGVMPDQAPSLAERIRDLPGLRLAGLMSHFPSADDENQALTISQLNLFEKMAGELARFFPDDHVRHIANSAALCRSQGNHCSMVRPGIALYGYYPYSDVHLREQLELKPVMTFKSSVVQVKSVPAGYGISYSHSFTTARQSRLAVLPIGYDDGYLRRLSNRAQVLIRGQRVPLVGNICMNACVADVSDLSDVAAGDEVVLLGRQAAERISADEIGGWMETISYEVLCLFGTMNRREYVDLAKPA